MVTSVERGGAVDVSSDEGGLLFPYSVVPHPPDSTLRGGIKERETKEVGDGEKERKKNEIEAGKDRMGKTGREKEEGSKDQGRRE